MVDFFHPRTASQEGKLFIAREVAEYVGLEVENVCSLVDTVTLGGKGNLTIFCGKLIKVLGQQLVKTPVKILTKNPIQLANKLAKLFFDQPRTKDIFCKVEVDKSFINFHFSTPFLGKYVALPSLFSSSSAGAGSLGGSSDKSAESTAPIMIEYSQPNVNKTFHVGHMRNVALGDCLVRMFEAVGHRVIAANYFGDEGTHIATCLWQILREYRVDEFLHLSKKIPDEERGEWLGSFYAKGSNALDLSSLTSLPFPGFVVAKVLSISDHHVSEVKEKQSKEKLLPTTVVVKLQTSTETAVTLVCNSSTLGVGDLVPYAPVGSIFNNKLVAAVNKKGVMSQGIILSTKDLSLDSKAPILPPGVECGTALTEVGRLVGSVVDGLSVEAEWNKRQLEVKSILQIMESPDNFELSEKASGILHLLRETKQWSLDEFQRIYKWMRVRFDHNFSESEVSASSLKMVNEFKSKGMLHESNGCYGLNFGGMVPSRIKPPPAIITTKEGKEGKEEKSDKSEKDDLGALVKAVEKIKVTKTPSKGVVASTGGTVGDAPLPFCMLLKSNGSGLYATKDLALAVKKFAEFKIQKSIYVVASEQSLHFKQVFKALEVLGYPEEAKRSHHVPYGMVKLKSGKMSSRKGNVIYFNELKKQLREFILEKYPNTPTEFTAVAGGHGGYGGDTPPMDASPIQLISLATIKYGMLKQDSMHDIVFELADWGKQTGNTGPYLLYAYSRMKAILRNCSFTCPSTSAMSTTTPTTDYTLLTNPQEPVLLLMMTEFWPMVHRVVDNYNPAPFCEYLYNFCRHFNSWFESVPRLVDEHSKILLATRLQFLYTMSVFLKRGLYLLGIETLERM